MITNNTKTCFDIISDDTIVSILWCDIEFYGDILTRYCLINKHFYNLCILKPSLTMQSLWIFICKQKWRDIILPNIQKQYENLQ